MQKKVPKSELYPLRTRPVKFMASCRTLRQPGFASNPNLDRGLSGILRTMGLVQVRLYEASPSHVTAGIALRISCSKWCYIQVSRGDLIQIYRYSKLVLLTAAAITLTLSSRYRHPPYPSGSSHSRPPELPGGSVWGSRERGHSELDPRWKPCRGP
jgi:hypothetical protein